MYWKALLFVALCLVVVVSFSRKEESLVGVAKTNVELKEAEQAAFLKSEGKYEHQPKETVGNITTQVDEMLHPDGSRGYTITEWRTNADGSVDKRITSHDKDTASTDWIQEKAAPVILTATST